MAANPQADPIPMSEADYLALEPEAGVRYEYIDGLVYAMTGASTDHVTISGNLYGFLFTKLRGKPRKPHDKDQRLQVAATGNYYFPDLMVTCGAIDYIADAPISTLRNPVVIFEVLSPSTESMDRNIKLLDYARTPSVQEYVMVSQSATRIDHCTRVKDQPNAWNLSMIVGMQSQLTLASLGVTLSFHEIYEDVTF